MPGKYSNNIWCKMKPKIALFVHDPRCSVQSGNGIIKALSSDYEFRLFSKNEMEVGFFEGVDIVAFPGGFGDSDTYDKLLKHNKKAIRDFVNKGGRYLGICMGAYWAGSHYFNILDGVDAVQYLSRPGTDTRRPHAKNISVTWQDTPMNMFWYDGCALVGNNLKFETIATYSNNDPMAIIQNRIGLIGCHPESEQFWYDSYSWMKGKYHNGTHHKLLLEFVNKLMEK
jgi:Biotin-protein ligase, N terminal